MKTMMTLGAWVLAAVALVGFCWASEVPQAPKTLATLPTVTVPQAKSEPAPVVLETTVVSAPKPRRAPKAAPCKGIPIQIGESRPLVQGRGEVLAWETTCLPTHGS